MIEYVSRRDCDPSTILGRIDRGGKMKVKTQFDPFFMPYDVAKAIMDAYDGPGHLKKVGNAYIIR